MNDKFSAQLRQHLLDTADERLAEGALAAVVDGVAVTQQHHPLVARLTWTPGRIGPFPSTALRYGLVAGALVALTVGVGLMGGGASPSGRTVFEGTWTSTDPIDGSTLSMIVGPGNEPDVRFEDDDATGPGCRRDPVKHFTAVGAGTVSGDLLETRFPQGGGCGLMLVHVPAGQFRHVETTDTLRDARGASWARPGAAGVETGEPTTQPTAQPKTQPTAVPASALPSSEVVPTCLDIPAGQTYHQDLGAMSLALTVPAAAQFEWQGYRDAFEVAGLCHFGRPVLIQASIVTHVNTACSPQERVEVSTPAEVVARLAVLQGDAASAPTQVTVGDFAATRFEIASHAATCADGIQLWEGVHLAAATTAVIYVVDVEGVALGITIQNRDDEAPTAQLAEAEAMIASMQIAP